MPIYDFRCRKCGHRFEELVRLGEAPPCPACKAKNPERLFSASAGVSTETTRSRATRVARHRATSLQREKDHADHEYRRNYYKEHSESD